MIIRFPMRDMISHASSGLTDAEFVIPRPS